jgi:hypothetical protein
MSRVRFLYHLVRASFLERVRRRGFLVVLFAVSIMSLAIATGRLVLRLDIYVGEYNSTWVGALVAGSTTVLLCFANFFVVKDAILLDRQTGVGELTAATPIGKFTYLIGKALSNFAVLLTIEGILFMSSVLVQLVHGDTNIEWLALVLPFVFIALPAMAAISSLAILFETLPGLRSGLGNVVFTALWFYMMFSIMAYSQIWLDLPGIIYVDSVFTAAAKAMNLPFTGGFSVEGGLMADPFARYVLWRNVNWMNEMVGWRLYWFAVAFALMIPASLAFDRFDSSRGVARFFHWRRKTGPDQLFHRPIGNGQHEALKEQPGYEVAIPAISKSQLAPVAMTPQANRFVGLLWANLRLTLKQPWWWSLVTSGFVITSLVIPVQDARSMWVPLIGLWLALTLSGIGLRESRHNVEQLVFSAPNPFIYPIVFTWLTGVLLMVVCGIGGLRVILVGEWEAALAWCIAAVFIPTFALTCGILSGNRRLFEGIFIAWWFIGPMGSKGTNLDFMGVHQEVVEKGVHWYYLIGTFILLALALLGRWRQLRSL